jgi:hypothetical protein
MSPTDDLVSVIIPTWNRSDMLRQAVESVRSQTWRNWQIIIADDGSTDNTAEIVSGMADVEYYRQGHSGQAAARNLGLRHARGRYLTTLDSDDLWLPGYLEKSIGALEALRADLVFSNWIHRCVNGEITPSYWETSLRWREYTDGSRDPWHLVTAPQSRRLFLEGCPSPSSGVVLRRQMPQPDWNDQLHITDDWCMLLEFALRPFIRIAFTMDPLWIKRITPESISERWDPSGEVLRYFMEDIASMGRLFGDRLTSEERIALDKNSEMFFLSHARKLIQSPGTRRKGVAFLGHTIRKHPIFLFEFARNFCIRNIYVAANANRIQDLRRIAAG